MLHGLLHLRHENKKGATLATDAHVFQITQTAALMCEHLPIPDSFDFVAFIDRWQTLIGAFVGGVLGVVAAFIVAFKQTHREWFIAASSVLPELMSLQATNDGIQHVLVVSHQTKRENKRTICRLLLKQRPTPIVLHSPTIRQLYDIDSRLYAHLSHCAMIHEQLEPVLALFKQVDNDAKRPNMSIDEVVAAEAALDVRTYAATLAWDYCVEHASLANYYLDRFVFRRWPMWFFQLRMRVLPNDLDRRSAYLLKNGKLWSESAKPALDENTPI